MPRSATRSTLPQVSSPRKSSARCASASAMRRARRARMSSSALTVRALSVLAQLGERRREELRPVPDGRTQGEEGNYAAEREQPGEEAEREQAIVVPENDHDEQHSEHEREAEAEQRDDGEHQDAPDPRPLLVDLAREDLDTRLHQRDEEIGRASKRLE